MSALTCPSRIEVEAERRAANALNIEIGTPMPRCLNKKPNHWPANSSGLRWMASGGSAFVFGPCSAKCPLKLA